ncbi:MAG: hypothetical protein WCP60_10680 [bacterium]
MIKKIRFFLPVLLICLGVSVHLQASIPEEASVANQSLASGHYTEALEAYKLLLATPQFEKFSSPELWYHRGLAEEKTGDLVAASLSYRRALLLDPTLPPARTRLAAVLGTLGVPHALDWHDQLLMRVHPDLLVLGGAILGWVGILAFVFLLLAGPRRPVLIGLALALFILGHGLSIFGTLNDPRRQIANQAVVTAKNAPTIHATPADSSASDGTLAPGSLLTILSRNGAWWKVSDGPAKTGWILSNAVTPLLPSSDRL